MFSKTITYKNFAEETCVQEFYFHLGKAELIELGIGNILGRLERMKNTNDGPEILKEVRELVHMAAGVRSDDGKRFIKDSEAKSALFNSGAYDELLFELATDAESAAEFVNKLFPPHLLEEMQKHVKKKEENVVTVEATVLKEDTRPAWKREKREPTKQELMTMPREEFLEAFRTHPRLAAEGPLNDA